MGDFVANFGRFWHVLARYLVFNGHVLAGVCHGCVSREAAGLEQFRNTYRLFESCEEWLFLPPQRPRPVAGDPGEEKAT